LSYLHVTDKIYTYFIFIGEYVMNRNTTRVVLAIAVLALASLGCATLLGDGALLSDNFSNSNSGWGLGTDADSSVEYSSGGLRVQVFTNNYYVWSTPNDNEYENIRIEVTVVNNNTHPTTAFGIMCNQQAVSDSFYYFAVTPAGEYAIAKASLVATDVFLTNNDKWGLSDAISQNASSYRVGAECGSGVLTLYVDGQQIASVNDSSYTAGGVGLFVWSGEDVSSADVSFDDFVVTNLK
jgi:hypothetical protein